MLKIIFRLLSRTKLVTFLNIVGLSLGISCATLIFLLINLHTGFDDYHEKASSTYRLVTNYKYPDGGQGFSAGVASPVAEALRKDYGFSDKVALMNTYREAQVASMLDSGKDDIKYKEQNVLAFVEPQFFDIFDYRWLKGSQLVLKDSATAVITHSYAEKYFQGINPLNKTLRLDNKLNVVVKGVVDDIPENTMFRQQIFVSYITRSAFEPNWKSNWNDSRTSTQCFFVKNNSQDLGQVNNSLRSISQKYLEGDDAQVRFFAAQPLDKVHLDTKYDAYLSKSIILTFGLVGLFLIVTACTNFVNMATAQALVRAKEVGVKKAIGATRRDLVWQFMTETAVIVFLSMMVSLVITWFAIPPMNTLFLSVFSISLQPTFPLAVFLLGIFLFTVVLSGLYPALILSGYNPLQALTQRINARTSGKLSSKRALVVFQFFTTYALIISAIIMHQQMKMTREASMGFDRNGIVVVPLPDLDSSRMSSLRKDLLAYPAVRNTSFLFTPPAYRSNIINSFAYDSTKPDERINFNVKKGDDNYIETFGLSLLSGSNFSDNDTVQQVLVNETLVKSIPGRTNENILGSFIYYDEKPFKVRGVLQDFNLTSLRNKIMPCGIIDDPNGFKNCAIKVGLTDLDATMKNIENIWNKNYPGYVYEANLLAENIGMFYVVEDIVQKLIIAFCIIAVVISSLGLYGLISFLAVQKAKEIGIRKTVGASVPSIILIFVKELLKPTLIGFLIAAPAAYFGMKQWLSGYQYHITIGPGIFVLSFLIPLVISLITIGDQAFKAATVSPINSLKSDQ
ncbi:MAG: ABC transporter permease [Chitinophagaceae bacterium]